MRLNLILPQIVATKKEDWKVHSIAHFSPGFSFDNHVLPRPAPGIGVVAEGKKSNSLRHAGRVKRQRDVDLKMHFRVSGAFCT